MSMPYRLCRAAVARPARSLMAVAGPSRLNTRHIHDSARRLRPAAQLAEPEEQPSYYHNPPASLDQHDPSYRRIDSEYPSRNAPFIQIPAPLPPDVMAKGDQSQAGLYPSAGVIDSVSMISICLRRPEHIPRAFQIFNNILSEVKSDSRRLPEAEIWARVIEGVASLGKDKPGDMSWRTWRTRAEALVGKWETMNLQGRGNAFLGDDGIKVYQGWLSGLTKASAPLDPLLPYLATKQLPLTSLLAAVDTSSLPLAYEALLALGRQSSQPELVEEVQELMGIDKERREMQAREAVDEVMPVLESAGKTFSRKKPQDTEVDSDTARFAVANLRKNLEKISTPSYAINRQRDLEYASLDAARAELEHASKLMKDVNVTDMQALQQGKLQSWMHEWYLALTAKLRHDLADLRNREEGNEAGLIDGQMPLPHTGTKEKALLLYLTLLPPEKLALITVLEVMRMAGSGGVSDGMKALRGMLAVGKAVETEYRAETIKSVAGVDSPHWLRTIDAASQRPTRALVTQEWQRLGHQVKDGREGSSSDTPIGADWQSVWTPSWSQGSHLGVGSFLLARLLKVAKVTRKGQDPETGETLFEDQPAFSHGYEYIRGRKQGLIRLNPAVARRLGKDHIGVVIHPKHLPMLVPPQPWVAYNEGAYLIHRVPVMRFKESTEQQTYLRSASEQGHLEPVFHGLDVLSSTPWKINRKVFDIVLTAWNSGEPIADIPAAEDKVTYDMPEKPPSRHNDPQARSLYVERMKGVMAQQRKDHAERCKFNYNIEIARSYLHDTFYLPHNMDFRGRAYPIPPHLSPVGDDLCRGLLTFGEKKPLGKAGLKWLQIHCANVFGYDKASFEERARFAQDHEADIFDSADHPLDGKQWWLTAEDPWQCLATCFELSAALRSANPEEFESSLPIHQDGTCNGMQHYAALGGDVRGAKAVNLENGDRPADIYTGVADIVNRVIKQDQQSGNATALLIPEAVGRKIVKQTVMTTVYGVTFVGARDQIAKQLINKGGIPQEHIYAVSSYLAKAVLSCIGDLFSGAKAIMDWLSTSARLVSRSIPPNRVTEAADRLVTTGRSSTAAQAKTRLAKELMTSVIWTTPLGLPVVQPYRKAVKKQVMTALQTVYITDPNAPSEVSPHKQATAFPPNFIHSLDATHMLLTALQCRRRNITFASVHDSYWTHAATVEGMSELIRDTFIHLHSADLIGELRAEFIDRYGEHRIPISSAKAISESTARRRARDAKRAQQIAELTGSHPTEELEKADETAAPVDTAEADATIDGESGMEDELDTDADADSNDFASIGLSTADVDAFAKLNDNSIEQERVGSHKFVKFKDVLPPCPPRGVFDVKRIKDSAYFFS